MPPASAGGSSLRFHPKTQQDQAFERWQTNDALSSLRAAALSSHVGARGYPVALGGTRWRSGVPGGARGPPATFFVREAQALETRRKRRGMNGDTFGISQCVSRFKERDVRVLPREFKQKANMRVQLPGPGWAAHRRDRGGSGAPDLPPPSPARGRRHPQAARRLSPTQSFAEQSRESIPKHRWQRCRHDLSLPIRVNHKSPIKGILPIQTFLEML